LNGQVKVSASAFKRRLVNMGPESVHIECENNAAI